MLNHSRKRQIQREVYPAYRSRMSWAWHLILISVLPRYMLAPLRREIHLAFVRLRSFFRRLPTFAHGEDLLVSVGVGPKAREGWVNIDGWKQPGVNVVHDCRKSLPLADSTAKGIFCEHFLEHIDYEEDVPFFLTECYRVLKPGGVLRIVTPDAEQYLIAYSKSGQKEIRDLCPFDMTGKTKMEIVNNVFSCWDHRYAYDYETLERALRNRGFASVTRMAYGESCLAELAIDSPERAKESLYVDAVK